MSGQRVLVVDDEPQILRALRARLHGAGYKVDVAATAEDALAAAAVQPPEAVILDLVLPTGNGTDVCRELRTWSDAPVIVLSAVGEEREKIAALDAGADDYVTKPVGIDELLARLRAVLRRTASAGRAGDRRSASSSSTSRSEPSRSPASRVHLTPHEFELLRVLAAERGQAAHAPDAAAARCGGPGTQASRTAAREHLAAAAEDRARPRRPALPADRAGRRLPARRSRPR